MATMNFKEALAKTITVTKKYVDDINAETIGEVNNNFLSKDEFGEDLGIAFEEFRDTLNTASLNEIYVDINEEQSGYEGIDLFSIDKGTVKTPEGNNTAYYRVPALTISSRGTLIAFADARFDTAADNSGRISIYCRRSEDKGKIWGPAIEVCKYPTNDDGTPTSSVARSMDSTVLATKSGKIFCLNGAWKTNTNNWSTYIKTPDPDWLLKLSVSDTDGINWTTYNLNELPDMLTDYPDDMVAMLGGVGQGIEMYDGTLVFPVQITRIPDGIRTVCATVMYSKDDGATWKIAHGLAPAYDSENNVVESAPGELLMNARGGSNRLTFKSTDLGETWEVYYDMNGQIGNGSVGCQGSSTKIKLDNNEIFLHSSPINTSNSYARDNITLYASYDWKNYDLIRTYYPQHGNAEGAGYSCLATGKLDGQSCLFAVYERQGNIAFRNLGIDLKEIANRAEKHFEVVDRNFETNKENLLSMLNRYSANESILFELLDNYLNTVSYEERQLMKVQLTRLAGIDAEGNIVDRQGIAYNKGGYVKTVGNTYYYDGRPENTINTNRLELSNDFTIDFDVCTLGITETSWNYLFSFNNAYNVTMLGLAADNTNEWKLVYNDSTHSYFEESTVAGQAGTFIDKWIHITITKSLVDGIKVYHNNVLRVELPEATGSISGYPYFTLGNDSNSTKRLNGKIANFKIYNKIVDSTERRILYENRRQESEFVYRVSQNVTKIPAGLEDLTLVNIVGSRTDEFDLLSIYDSGTRGTVWGIGGEVTYDLNENMIIFNKNSLNIANTDNFLSIDFSIDFDVFIDGEPGSNWSQVFCIGNLTGGIPGYGLAVDGTGTWNPITDGNGSYTYTDPQGNFIGRWIHITATKSSTTGCSVYQDGVLVFNSQTNANMDGTQSMLGYPSIAIGNNTHPVKQFYGKIANFKIYNKVLTASEIEQIVLLIGRITLRANFSPLGTTFSDTVETDWTTQKVTISFNLDDCTNISGENVISIGENIGSWAGNNIHFYYYPDTKRLLVQCMQGGSAQNIELLNQSGTMTVEFSSEGLTIDGRQFLSSNYPTFVNIAALTSTQIGSTEGAGRSNATAYSITIKNK